MIKTKLCELNVICENCNTIKYPIFINNQNKDICDICGQIKNKVLYIEKGIGQSK